MRMTNGLGQRISGTIIVAVVLLATLFPVPVSVAGRQATPALSCEPLVITNPVATPAAVAVAPPAPFTGETVEITVGYIPISIYAPVYLAEAKGYYDALGLDVTLQAFAGGTDPIALTGSGQIDFAAVGAGPAFWNSIALDLPVQIVAPGHAEGSPVATPLMISRENCLSGEVGSIADLAGQRVSINARGGTEYWLGAALATGGLTIDDVDLQTIAFPDAVAALDTGAIDAAMIAEPLATLAEQQGIAVRLLPDFPVQDIQPTAIIGNRDFTAQNPEVTTAFVTAYLMAARDLSGGSFNDPANLAIISEYTSVPAELLASSVQPLYFPNGEINVDSLDALQRFFIDRGQLEYDEPIDPATAIDIRFVEAAVAALGPFPAD
ncbi:MAG: ABC transporter substrate-binding protein [Thermomicrobiales bacterium]